MKIGTMFCGRVEALGGESIQTKFFVLGVPIAPMESYYVFEETTNGVRGVEIPTHGGSVLAGYLRSWSFIVAGVSIVFAAFIRGFEELWALGVPAAIVWVWSSFFYGKISDEEYCRRLVLAVSTDLKVDPSLLPPELVAKVREALREKMSALELSTDATKWSTDLPPRSTWPLLYAFARYVDPERGGAWHPIAERVFGAILSDEKYREAIGTRATKLPAAR